MRRIARTSGEGSTRRCATKRVGRQAPSIVPTGRLHLHEVAVVSYLSAITPAVAARSRVRSAPIEPLFVSKEYEPGGRTVGKTFPVG